MPAGDVWDQAFRVPRPPGEVLDAAEVYLDGAGLVHAGLAGRLDRLGDGLIVHHGRMVTRITTEPAGGATSIRVVREGEPPLRRSRRALYVMGLGGAGIAWALAWYRNPLSPLVTAAFFFASLVAAAVVLFVVDRSMERRSQAVVLALEEAIRGDPFLVLRRQVDGLERTASVVNALLFYCGSLAAEFLVFVVLLQNGIDDAVTLAVMRQGFLFPVVPAAVFGLLYWLFTHRVHRERMRVVEARLGRAASRRPSPAS